MNRAAEYQSQIQMQVYLTSKSMHLIPAVDSSNLKDQYGLLFSANISGASMLRGVLSGLGAIKRSETLTLLCVVEHTHSDDE